MSAPWAHAPGKCGFCLGRTGKGTRTFTLSPFDLDFTSGTDISVLIPITEPHSWRACGRCAPLVEQSDVWALAQQTKAGERRRGAESRCTTAEHAAAFRQLLDHLSPA